MTGPDRPNLDDLFRKLDRWRHLPAYRLEPNLAPFFGLFLPEILGIEREDCVVIPEFPLPLKCLKETTKKLGRQKKENNLSVKVDYAVFSKKHAESYFVELKTDKRSYRKEQLCYLKEAREQGIPKLVGELIEIVRATKSQRKYAHLLLLFADTPLIKNYKKSLLEEAVSQNKLKRGRKWDEVLACEAIYGDDCKKPKIVYITPKGDKPKRIEGVLDNINFAEVADCVERHSKLGGLFACHLKRWRGDAGVSAHTDSCSKK